MIYWMNSLTIYLDDLLIYSKSKVQSMRCIFAKLFDHLCKETLFVKQKKCEFRKDSVEYLGHIVR